MENKNEHLDIGFIISVVILSLAFLFGIGAAVIGVIGK